MTTTVPVGDGIPAAFYRNAIDLNRFSNSVSKKLITSYNNVILKAVEQLEKIEKQPLNERPAYKTARLRALIKQTKESLNTWADGSVQELISELEGVANVQAGFIENQIKNSIPKGMTEKIHDQLGYSVNSVAISPSFAKSVVNTDPTALNISVLRSDLAGAKAPKGAFKLTAKEGQTITLPNGNTVKKSFRELAVAEAKRLNQVVRTGLLSGDTTPEIVKELVGNLQKDQKGSLSQLLAQGGVATKRANSQVTTIVRTTVNQVTNTASQSVYKANSDVTEEYRYVATLDSRTSPVCRDLDGQIFKYDEGPVPPQHFGCRSTTVAVINYKKWGFTPPPAGKRASADGPVPANTTYGKWLYGERAKGSKFKPGKEQIAALGEQKAKYFNRLSNKYGPDQALKKLIREDNTEVSLAQLQKRYGKPENIKPKEKLVDWDAVAKSPKTKTALKESKKLSEQISKIKAPVVNEAYKNEIKNFSQNELTNLKTFLEQSIDTSSKGSKQYNQSVSELNVVNSLLKTKPKYVKLTDAQKKLVDKQIQSKIKKTAVSEVASFSKLSQADQDEINFLKGLKLDSKDKKTYWEGFKSLGINSKYIPKGQAKTITPKQLARRIEDAKISKLQTKFDKAAQKALEPKKVIQRDIRRWDDPSLLNKDLAIESNKSSVRKQSGKGKTTTRDLFLKPKAEDVGLTKAQYTKTQELIGEWAGKDYQELRGVQIQQAKAVGAQLNPGQVQTLKRFKTRTELGKTKAKASSIQSTWARDADKMEDFIAKNPKWKGLPEDLLPNQIESDGTIFRGMAFDDFKVVESVIDSYKNGDPSLAMESWSASRRVAGDFMSNELKTNQVLIKQVNKYGTSIEPWNGLNEREIIQPRGVRYKVQSVKTTEFEEMGEEFTFTEIILQAL
jgi:SPP1 gp7 family putative phage head morphogenesis protein